MAELIKNAIPKFRTTGWYKLILFIDYLGFGEQKWTEKVIDWLVSHNKIACKIGKEAIYFKDLL